MAETVRYAVELITPKMIDVFIGHRHSFGLSWREIDYSSLMTFLFWGISEMDAKPRFQYGEISYKVCTYEYKEDVCQDHNPKRRREQLFFFFFFFFFIFFLFCFCFLVDNHDLSISTMLYTIFKQLSDKEPLSMYLDGCGIKEVLNDQNPIFGDEVPAMLRQMYIRSREKKTTQTHSNCQN